jgi:hypothetical protein
MQLREELMLCPQIHWFCCLNTLFELKRLCSFEWYEINGKWQEILTIYFKVLFQSFQGGAEVTLGLITLWRRMSGWYLEVIHNRFIQIRPYLQLITVCGLHVTSAAGTESPVVWISWHRLIFYSSAIYVKVYVVLASHLKFSFFHILAICRIVLTLLIIHPNINMRGAGIALSV